MEKNVTSSKKVFFDESETESEEESAIITTTVKKNINVDSITLPFNNYLFVNIDEYKFKSWDNFFPDGVDIYKLLFNPTWNNFFTDEKVISHVSKIESELGKIIKTNKKKKIVPPPELVFNIFNIVNLSDIKIIILGQDPYQNDKWATGFSFSIPLGVKSTSSLNNIYKNLVKYKHIETAPTTGCLTGWVLQGCLMLNSALTTFVDESNAHKKIWLDFTKELMIYINNNCDRCVFLSWGADAFKMCNDIDRNKHHVIASSHPSGFSYSNTFTSKLNGESIICPSFESTDHFGLANKYLRKNKKKEIIWDLIY